MKNFKSFYLQLNVDIKFKYLEISDTFVGKAKVIRYAFVLLQTKAVWINFNFGDS